jgi:K+-transporting ATPase A subunit
MENLLKSDVFFIITTVSVIILTIIFSIAGVYLIRILHEGRDLLKKITYKIEEAEESIGRLEERISMGTSFLKAVFSSSFIKSLFRRRK